MPSASYGSVPFSEQIQFFRNKLNIPTEAWTDIYNAEHDWAFMVAGANRDALVSDFREAVEKAIIDGTTLEEFRRDFDSIVARHGWDYNGGREWRSRTIYETNLFSSYNAGRYEQLRSSRDVLPYWQYNHSDAVQRPRRQHLAWDGLVLSAEDTWWNTHFPINAWGCQCYVIGLSDLDLEEMGKDGPDQAPEINLVEREIGQRSPDGPRTVRVPEGIDPGFEHAPGKSRLDSSTPPNLPGAPSGTGGTGPGRPTPGPMSAPSNPPTPAGAGKNAVEDFLDRFGATPTQPVIYRDAVGEALTIGSELFMERSGGVLEMDSGLLPLLAQTIQRPDEIWAVMEWHPDEQRALVRRRYLAQFLVTEAARELMLFEWSETGWRYQAILDPQEADTAALRTGARLYHREDDE